MQTVRFLDLGKINSRHQDEIKAAVDRVLTSGWYLLGNEVKSFEKEYADYIGTSAAIGCANGLDALSLILMGYLNLGVFSPGDEIIVPANTYIASILAITRAGLTPVLVEPDPETLQIDHRLIESHISPRTRGVMIVHLYGRCAYREEIGDICKARGLKLIEDNAQAHGCFWGGHRTGSLGDAAAHSFYPGKNLGALGDGGAVTTSDPELERTVRALANYGSSRKYVFPYQGINSRLDEIQAAVLRVKLQHLDADNQRRREIAAQYLRYLNGGTNPIPGASDNNVYHLFPVFCEKRDELMAYLRARGIETMIHYPIPPHLQECYPEWNARSYPITEKIHNRELSLPISPVMTDAEVRRVIETILMFELTSGSRVSLIP